MKLPKKPKAPKRKTVRALESYVERLKDWKKRREEARKRKLERSGRDPKVRARKESLLKQADHIIRSTYK